MAFVVLVLRAISYCTHAEIWSKSTRYSLKYVTVLVSMLGLGLG